MAAPWSGPMDRLGLADPILRPTREPPILSRQNSTATGTSPEWSHRGTRRNENDNAIYPKAWRQGRHGYTAPPARGVSRISSRNRLYAAQRHRSLRRSYHQDREHHGYQYRDTHLTERPQSDPRPGRHEYLVRRSRGGFGHEGKVHGQSDVRESLA